jgi:hypothetical protein
VREITGTKRHSRDALEEFPDAQSRLTKAGPSTPHDLFARETVMLRSGLQN